MRTKLIPLVLTLLAVSGSGAGAHLERAGQLPDGSGKVPTYRTSGPTLVVCKPDSAERIADLPAAVRQRNTDLLAQCRSNGFEHLQAAVNAVTERGTRILVLPGVYKEEPSLAPHSDACKPVAAKTTALTYDEQVKCPHVQNLVAIFGDGTDTGNKCDDRYCDLQIEGTGARPEDVVVDGEFGKLNVVRADRADGIYFRNFTVQHAQFNALYVMETDGFVIDRMLGRWNDEFGFTTFATDHGLYKDCEAHGNGDSGISSGSSADLHGLRTAVEITRCESHHNTRGLSGTAGNSLYVHDNAFHHNAVGMVVDSMFPNNLGQPQDSSTYTKNLVYSNNSDYYRYFRDGTCAKPLAQRGYDNGVVCPAVGVPVGTGILVAGGNQNWFSGNSIHDNWRYGTMQFGVPAALRNDTAPASQIETSHFNTYILNRVGQAPNGGIRRNGTDFWWDEQGEGNCWHRNLGSPVTSDPLLLPDCGDPIVMRPGNPVKIAMLVPCTRWTRTDYDPAGCDWFRAPTPPA